MRFPARRLIHLALVLLGVTLATFVLVELLPGDTALAILGPDATPQDLEALRRDLGHDRPLPARYARWLAGVAAGDLGHSHHTGEPVAHAIGARVAVSIELMLLAQVLALAATIPVALVAASRPSGWFDRVSGVLSFALMSMPGFALAILLVFLLALRLDLLPATGFAPLSAGLIRNLRTLMLPALTLALIELPVYVRVLRGDLIQTLARPLALAARARGVSSTRFLLRHALRLSSLGLVTLVGLNVGRLVAGAVIVEQIFALPGVGRLLVDSIYRRDPIMVQGVVLFIAAAYVVVNFAVETLYGLLDPRTRDAAVEG
jgi:peptide/nickel transport system permease protein